MASERESWPEASARKRRGSWIVLVFAVLVVAALSIYRGWLVKNEPGPHLLTFYGFSALENVMNDGIFPAFQKAWRERTGERVEFVATFAGSGTITDRILEAFPAEVAILASEIDARRLARRGVVPDRVWQRLPRGGVVSRSPMVIAVSQDQYGRIRDFADLATGECGVIFPDPASSGAGEWGVLAVYGATQQDTGDADRAAEQLARLVSRVKHYPPSASRARALFQEGAGDALVTYESEIRTWKIRDGGRPVYMIHPPRTILSEHLVVKINRNVPADGRERVDAFVEFLWSSQAQRLLEAHGFRSADPEVAREAAKRESFSFFTLQDLGGPTRAEEAISRFCDLARQR